VFDYLVTHGPTTTTEIAQGLDAPMEQTRYAIRNRPDVFVVVGRTQIVKFKSLSARMGVRGIHDGGK
jgi:hypothetical protein